MNAAETVIQINAWQNADGTYCKETKETTRLSRDALAVALDSARRSVRYLESLMEFMDGRS